MKNTLETRLGIFFALAFVVAFIVIEMAGGFEFFRSGRRVRAEFNTVQELKVGDPVRMAGVDIGRVEKIGLRGGKVEVTMKILNNEAVVRTDSIASIRFAGLLGQNLVSITFGTPGAPAVEDNKTIATVDQPDLNSLMTKLDEVASGINRVTATFSGSSFQDMLAPLTEFMQENRPKLTAILANLQLVSDNIAQGRGTVGKLISDEALYTSALAAVTNLNSTADEIKVTIGQAKGVVTEINEGRGTLGKLTRDETLYRETTTAMTNLREILEKINQGKGSVGQLVNDDSFLRNAKLSLQKLDKAAEGLEDQGPLSVLSIAVNSLF
jgi:phospholipid/cholesterol/gamma-HCH transport system substrate-binding protein